MGKVPVISAEGVRTCDHLFNKNDFLMYEIGKGAGISLGPPPLTSDGSSDNTASCVSLRVTRFVPTGHTEDSRN